MKFVEIRTTFDNEMEAKKMAEMLLNERLVACGQITRIESHYTWKNERFVTQEFMLMLKTRKTLLKKLKLKIKNNHSYDVAEFTCNEIVCSKEYGEWIKENTVR